MGKSNSDAAKDEWHLYATIASVEPLNWATRPLWQTWCVSAAKLQRESGTLWVAGSSHAKALTCTISSGGKRPGATRSSTFFQPGKSLFEEAFAPLADDLPAGIQALSDFIIGQTIGRMKDHLGADNLAIWQRIFDGSALQFLSFLSCEFDFEGALLGPATK